MINLSKYSSADFDRGASHWKEALWWIVRAVIFLPPLPFPSSFKCSLLRSFGANIGKSVIIRSGVNISMPWRFRIGNNSWLGENVQVLSLEQVTIGNNCCISQGAFLCTGSHNFHTITFDLITKKISIEDSCWIGARAFIGAGVTMYEGSLAGAMACVVKDIHSNHKALGNPASTTNLT